jgi:2-C-methyl-D-erythritol 2,4-cyclodiphosphate synthase
MKISAKRMLLSAPCFQSNCEVMRIGHGFDAHRFCEGSQVTIGGVRIDHARGIEAHSDGDVLVHAVCDALLGAAGLGDIGRHFPDTDDQYRGIDSRILLRRVRDALAERGLRVSNLDCTVIAQAPRMGPHLEAMSLNMAEDMGVAADRVNVKATTTERMGYTGRGEGIAAHAVVLLAAT